MSALVSAKGSTPKAASTRKRSKSAEDDETALKKQRPDEDGLTLDLSAAAPAAAAAAAPAPAAGFDFSGATAEAADEDDAEDGGAQVDGGMPNIDIAALMNGALPVRKCVHLVAGGAAVERALDMTPAKLEPHKLIAKGGSLTFLGMWDELDVMLVVARDQAGLADNTHKLQPPFHNAKVKGDILLLRSDDTGAPQDFELDEFQAFSKLRIREWEPKGEEENNEDDEDDDDDEDEDEDEDDSEDDASVEGSDDEDDEEDMAGFVEMLLENVVKKFKESNGRDPDAAELAAFKKTISEKFADGGADEEDGGEDGEGGAEDEDEDEPEIDSKAVLDMLIVEFEKQHGRQPTEEEVQKWIETLKAAGSGEEAARAHGEANGSSSSSSSSSGAGAAADAAE